MKANTVILAAAIFVATTMTFVAVSKDTNAAFFSGGKYQGVSSHGSSGINPDVWVVNTETGEVKRCRENHCSEWVR